MNIPDTHKQVEVVVNTDSDGEIRFSCDNLIAPLIQKLNDAGLNTKFCCSGHEENAFGFMYIYFQQTTDEEHANKLYELIDGVSEYFIPEFNYKMKSVNGNHRMTLTDPTEEELRLAVKLCFGVDFEDVFYIDNKGYVRQTGMFKKAIVAEVILRPTIPDEKFDKEYIEENFKHITAGINQLSELL